MTKDSDDSEFKAFIQDLMSDWKIWTTFLKRWTRTKNARSQTDVLGRPCVSNFFIEMSACFSSSPPSIKREGLLSKKASKHALHFIFIITVICLSWYDQGFYKLFAFSYLVMSISIWTSELKINQTVKVKVVVHVHCAFRLHDTPDIII